MCVCFVFRDYASVVSGRVQELGLVVQTQQLSPTVSLADALDSAAQQGLLYAMIITSQHELHRSVTLTILHGRNPQGTWSSKHTHRFRDSLTNPSLSMLYVKCCLHLLVFL